uniref:Uncharacterized protein n=1 Tax=Mus musculus TaxID=10090 RepID=Q3TY52_MOUSE|nr:unnamed protein product [Mus musculus]
MQFQFQPPPQLILARTWCFLVALVSFGLSRIFLFCIQGNCQLNGLSSPSVSSTFVQGHLLIFVRHS